ncbi:DUF3566 domain-containing protein [Streptomyces sp. ICBB 8177]|uniref:DUF3566 domain-containing protein n=1 Tax=Streptomyces sp. ICBB 8177 TaxID=563922 RepID=UPI000D678720|nr:DUF3566 domain-containing protein [Streptomyces sp. ICBB 8177]PWI41206.1 hypothetical protein CK485_28165 [Streptomyces sp. ICBB 8177]
MTDTRGGARPPQPHHPPQAYAPPKGATMPSQGASTTSEGAGSASPLPSSGASGPAGPSGTEGGQGLAVGGGAGVRKPRPAAARTAPRTRSARLRVAKADPWSVMKVSFLFSIALGICTVVAVAVLWMVLDALGVFSTVGSTISDATGSGSQGGFDLQSFLSLPRVVTFTAVIAVIDVVLMTALATLGSFVYNLSAGFVGGVELTLAEDE